MADQTPAERIMADYPYLAFLLNDPEVGPLLLAAVDPNQGFDANTFQAKLIGTNWWRTSTASQRQWETLNATDPATAAAQREQWKQQLDTEATEAGVQLKPADLEWWVDQYLPKGIAYNDPRILSEISRVYQTRPDLRTGTGSIDTIKDQMHAIANSYFRDLTAADYDWWSANIASGAQSIQNFQTVIQNQARDRFPTFFKEINAGLTPEQLFAQQKSAIAKELEVDPSTIDLAHDPRWSKVLGVANPDGTMRPMTYNESIMLARNQPEWKGTASAQQQGADLTTTILKTFGAIG
jgi:hypothetical protein